MPESRIDVLVHPQSVVHSLVEFVDGSVLAQLGSPDMRTPIAFCLAWPGRMPSPSERLDLARIARLDFEPPAPDRFPALRLAREALRAGGSAPAVLNAANEVAVESFLAGRIGFLDIADVVARNSRRDPGASPGNPGRRYRYRRRCASHGQRGRHRRNDHRLGGATRQGPIRKDPGAGRRRMGKVRHGVHQWRRRISDSVPGRPDRARASCHELGHYWVARRCGVRVEVFLDRLRGRSCSAGQRDPAPAGSSAPCRWAATSRCSGDCQRCLGPRRHHRDVRCEKGHGLPRTRNARPRAAWWRSGPAQRLFIFAP